MNFLHKLQLVGGLKQSLILLKKLTFQIQIELKFDFAEAHNNLGNVLHEINECEKAVFSYKRAIELKPNYADSYENLGKTLTKLDKFGFAISSFEKVMKINPKHENVNANIGRVLLKKGQHKEGIEKLRKGNGAVSFDIYKGLSIKQGA